MCANLLKNYSSILYCRQNMRVSKCLRAMIHNIFQRLKTLNIIYIFPSRNRLTCARAIKLCHRQLVKAKLNKFVASIPRQDIWHPFRTSVNKLPFFSTQISQNITLIDIDLGFRFLCFVGLWSRTDLFCYSNRDGSVYVENILTKFIGTTPSSCVFWRRARGLRADAVTSVAQKALSRPSPCQKRNEFRKYWHKCIFYCSSCKVFV